MCGAVKMVRIVFYLFLQLPTNQPACKVPKNVKTVSGSSTLLHEAFLFVTIISHSSKRFWMHVVIHISFTEAFPFILEKSFSSWWGNLILGASEFTHSQLLICRVSHGRISRGFFLMSYSLTPTAGWVILVTADSRFLLSPYLLSSLKANRRNMCTHFAR